MDVESFLLPYNGVALSVLLAFLSHQVFRKQETYSLFVHVSLLTLPPLGIAVCIASRPLSIATMVDALPVPFVTYLSSLSLSVLTYRLSPLHPLACYPGPLVCRISSFWLAFISLPGFQHRYIKRLHEKYGDVVRIGPNILSINDASTIPSLLGTPGVSKGPSLLGRLLSDKILSLIAIQDTVVHLQRRRPWVRGLTPTAVKGYEDQIAVRTQQLVARLEEEKGEVRLDQWFNYFSYDFMSDMAWIRRRFRALSGTGSDNFWSILDEAMLLATFLGHVPWLGVHLGRIPFAAASVKAINDHSRELTKMRIRQGAVKRDLFYYLNHEDLPEAERMAPPIQQVVDDGILAIVAGADTVASALTSLFVCLLAHPEVYKKLQAEVDNFYAQEDVLNAKHYRGMHYLNAVINETFRLFPPVPSCTQRQVPREGCGITVGSRYIPPGTSFWVHAYSLHRDPRNFSPYSETFWPDRWLIAAGHLDNPDVWGTIGGTNPTKPDFVHNETAFIPFSHGPMNCVGKSLALQEMRMVVCALIRRFHLRAPGDELFGGSVLCAYESEFRDYFVTTRGKVPVFMDVRKKEVAGIA